jgi:hypothetical protein
MLSLGQNPSIYSQVISSYSRYVATHAHRKPKVRQHDLVYILRSAELNTLVIV